MEVINSHGDLFIEVSKAEMREAEDFSALVEKTFGVEILPSSEVPAGRGRVRFAVYGRVKTCPVLSIEGWNGPDGWNWNQWWEVKKCDVFTLDKCSRSPRFLFRWLREEGLLSERSKGKVAVDDDGYNLVVVDRSTREPLFALAYGEIDYTDME